MRRSKKYIGSCISVVALTTIALTLSTVSLFNAPFFVSSAYAVPARPSAVVQAPVYPFGSVSQGTKVEHTFTIENQGEADLKILKVVAGCGCTATNIDQDLIAPGEQAKIKATFDTTGMKGSKKKSIRVYTNDPDTSISLLTLQGVVESDIKLTPARVDFGETFQGSSKSQQVEIEVSGSNNVRIDDIISRSKHVVLDIKKKADKKSVISISLSPDVRLGEHRSRVVVNLAGGKSPRAINIPIYASVKNSVHLKPSVLSFGVLEGDTPVIRSVKLLNNQDAPISVVAVESDSTQVKSSIKEIQKGKIFVVQVEIDPKDVTDEIRSIVTIKTDSEDVPELALNVFGMPLSSVN